MDGWMDGWEVVLWLFFGGKKERMDGGWRDVWMWTVAMEVCEVRWLLSSFHFFFPLPFLFTFPFPIPLPLPISRFHKYTTIR